MTIPKCRKRLTRLFCFMLGCVVAVYLTLVFAGGGLAPRRDDSFAWNDDTILLFAHRGACQHVPEDSEAALAEAQQAGFAAVEIDVRKTKDNQLAVFHSTSAREMLGEDISFGELTLAEVKARRLLFQGQETTNTVSTLREIFQHWGTKFRFYLDVKNKGFEDADRVVELIREFDLYDRTIVASGDPLFIAYVEHKYPRVNTALERFDAAQVWLYRLTPTRWKPDFLSGSASNVSAGHAEWLRKQHLLSKRIVYGAGGTNYQRMLELGIRKAIVNYDPAVHNSALSPRGN